MEKGDSGVRGHPWSKGTPRFFSLQFLGGVEPISIGVQAKEREPGLRSELCGGISGFLVRVSLGPRPLCASRASWLVDGDQNEEFRRRPGGRKRWVAPISQFLPKNGWPQFLK